MWWFDVKDEGDGVYWVGFIRVIGIDDGGEVGVVK